VRALAFSLRVALEDRLQGAAEAFAAVGNRLDTKFLPFSTITMSPPLFLERGLVTAEGFPVIEMPVSIGRDPGHNFYCYVAALTTTWPPVLALGSTLAGQRVLVGAVDDLGPELLGPWADEVAARAVAEYARRL